MICLKRNIACIKEIKKKILYVFLYRYILLIPLKFLYLLRFKALLPVSLLLIYSAITLFLFTYYHSQEFVPKKSFMYNLQQHLIRYVKEIRSLCRRLMFYLVNKNESVN